MSLRVRLLEITSLEKSHSEMERVGVDPVGIQLMAPKHFHYNLKVEGLSSAQANVIKQDFLSDGGEAAVSRGCVSCSTETTGAILSGTKKQFQRLIKKLKSQSFGLAGLADDIVEGIRNIELREVTLATRTRTFKLGPRTLIMGVLNVTPDSFFDGGSYLDKGSAVTRALEMIDEGADIIDVGGESTRPGAACVDADEELRRVVAVVGELSKKGLAVSVDTTKSVVARHSLEAGAEIINDVSAMCTDPAMAGVVRESGAGVVLMHMRGTPQSMQKDVEYDDLMAELFAYLAERLEFAEQSGIEPDKTLIDPGVGFGKSSEGNLEIIKNLRELGTLGRPLLVGTSRKSFIHDTLGAADEGDRLEGTLATLACAVLQGAHIVRVHDVREARRVVDMADAVKNA